MGFWDLGFFCVRGFRVCGFGVLRFRFWGLGCRNFVIIGKKMQTAMYTISG